MWWAAAISTGLQLFGASKQKKAGKQAKVIAGMNVEAEKLESAEQFRRSEMESKQRVGYAKAVAGASGFSVQPGTSQARYIDALESEDKRQREFALAASGRKQKILKAGGQAAYTSAQAGMWGSLAGAATSAGTAYGMWKNA